MTWDGEKSVFFLLHVQSNKTFYLIQKKKSLAIKYKFKISKNLSCSLPDKNFQNFKKHKTHLNT